MERLGSCTGTLPMKWQGRDLPLKSPGRWCQLSKDFHTLSPTFRPSGVVDCSLVYSVEKVKLALWHLVPSVTLPINQPTIMAQREVATLAPVEPPSGLSGSLDGTQAVDERDTSRFLIQSPYTEIEHQLDLDSLDHENQLLAQALVNLRATRDDYATAPYVESFNWGQILEEVQRLARISTKPFHRSSFYIVAFRSQIKPSTEYSHLGDLDKAAHREAVESGGFLK